MCRSGAPGHRVAPRARYALFLSCAALSLLAPAGAPAQPDSGPRYPRIKRLEPKDVVFGQLMEDLDEAYRDEASLRSGILAEPPSEPPLLYAYAMAQPADLLSLAARLNLPYDSIATLNRLSGSGDIAAGTELLIPSRPGIFLPETPVSDLEYLMFSWRRDSGGGAVLSVRRGGKTERFLYLAAERFNPAERVYFLSGAYRYPLPRAKLSSGFGMRVSPLTGAYSMHAGIDLSAPEGTPVMAARNGTVSAAGFDAILGNYVVLDHDGQHQSVYGHLSAISVSLKQEVKSGTILGTVGSTGKSTGPHLHFEIRVRGEARNPESYLPRLQK